MSNLQEFDIHTTTQSTRQDILFSLKDMLSLGMVEIKQSLGGLVGTPHVGKNQVKKDLARWEKRVKRQRA